MKSRFCTALCGVLLLLSIASGIEMKELTTMKDAIVIAKAEEVVAVGLFKSRTDKNAHIFKRAASMFENSGIAFATSFEPSIAERYDVDAFPAVILLQNFDKETGRRKRGRKPMAVFEGDLTVDKLQHFIFTESLPPAVTYPSKHGVDEVKRFSMAFHSSPYPVLHLYSESVSELERVRPGAVELGNILRGKAIVVQVDIGGMDSEGTEQLLTGVMRPRGDVRSGKTIATLVDTSRHQVVPYEEAVSAAANGGEGMAEGAVTGLQELVENYLESRPAAVASSKKKAKKSKKKDKKKKDKKKKGHAGGEL